MTSVSNTTAHTRVIESGVASTFAGSARRSLYVHTLHFTYITFRYIVLGTSDIRDIVLYVAVVVVVVVALTCVGEGGEGRGVTICVKVNRGTLLP